MHHQSSAIQLHSEVKGSGYPILCLHGHPGFSSSMSVFTQHLSSRFQTLTPDLRGYGKSQVKQPFVMADHLVDLQALLQQFQISECLILGWSLGGILAMELAMKLPQTVQGLILIATAARPRSNHPPITWKDNLYTGVASILNHIYPAWQWNIDTFAKRSLYRHLIQHHTAVAYKYLAQGGMSAYLKTSDIAHRALNQAIGKGYNRLPDLHQIHCPCLVLVGANDKHITAESSLETARNLNNSQFHCYPNVAHLFPWEIPDQVLADIDCWLDNHLSVGQQSNANGK
jgi:proline iminopeptidase